MDQKVILITGSNKGIGFEIARQLAKLGHQIILTARHSDKGLDAQKKLAAENLAVTFLELDITNDESIHSAFAEIKKDFGKLDVIVNNAAILPKEDYSLLKDSTSIFEKTIETNAKAQLNVVKTFHTLIPAGGRIIMVSSSAGSMSDPAGGWSPAYCVSKSLLGAITRHLAYELSSRKIMVNAFDPGWVKTDMGGRSAPRSLEQGADTAIWLATIDKYVTGKFFRDRKEIPW